MTEAAGPDRAARVLLGLAAVAVMFAAADTYVVVLALSDMMAGAGLSADELQRAAPIVSGFLLGYVAVLPLIGRLADVRGRVPVLVGSLLVFAIGSLVTAASYDLTSMVVGRFFQGVGGGGLVPATLALVADLYPVHKRGVPLGLVGAVQELGAVLGPLYGAVVLSFGTWRDIFWINLAVGLVLAAVVRSQRSAVAAGSGAGDVADLGDAAAVGPGPPGPVQPHPAAADRSRDWVSAALVVLLLVGLVLTLMRPRALTSDVTIGLAFLPVAGSSRWLTPVALVSLALLGLLVLRSLTAAAPLLRMRTWPDILRQVDVPGTSLLALALGGVILAFATADPEVQVFSAAGPWLLAVSAVAIVAFWLRNQRVANPLLPAGTLAAAPAWGALVVSFFIGSALIAALVDIPIFARLTVYNDDQLAAALVLVRLLVALPVGAVVGGWLTQRVPAGAVTALGMAAATVGFAWMSTWGLESLEQLQATVPLVLAGLGFGLALAPVNAALLAATEAAVHGVASALLVVARMVGMLVGISALTTVGLRRYYAEQGDVPSPMEVCGSGVSRCPEFSLILQEAGIVQIQTIFVGAAGCCVVAGVLAVALLNRAPTREVRTSVLGGIV